MEKEDNATLVDYTICPQQYCFHWLEKGDRIESGPHKKQFKKVTESGCGYNYGYCLRDERLRGFDELAEIGAKDMYEPCEPALDKAGLAWDYFVLPSKRKKV